MEILLDLARLTRGYFPYSVDYVVMANRNTRDDAQKRRGAM